MPKETTRAVAKGYSANGITGIEAATRSARNIQLITILI
jgi:hypothetical protein